MSRALRHVQKCLERQVQHSELNAFVTYAKAAQLQDAASAIANSEFDGMNCYASYSVQEGH
jgi:aspartyl-tRNA(Asn)/glutamyl-tRNA(Gln) amidotransferase subunit A